jgi:glycerol-3-phosphate dehydrogenase
VPSRKEQLAKLRLGTKDKPFDMLVIGGGATGTGIAVDAVSRGLSTALVERDDFAAGTSSRSTKLVHGGVRYLEKAALCLDYGQLKLVYEALAERKSLLENAPYLSNPLPIMMVRTRHIPPTQQLVSCVSINTKLTVSVDLRLQFVSWPHKHTTGRFSEGLSESTRAFVAAA